MASDEIDAWIAAAEGGTAAAQNHLATGHGIAPDQAGALYWYGQAIKSGYVDAMWNAGSMLVDGEDGIAKNEALGLRLIEAAAGANQSSACLYLASCHAQGTHGKARDEALALYWRKRAGDYKAIQIAIDGMDIAAAGGLNLVKPRVAR